MGTLERSGKEIGLARAGFTMIELLFVIIIGSVVTSMALTTASTYLNRQGAVNARDAFIFLAIRTRSAAIERGDYVRLVLDVAGDRVSVVTGSTGAGDTLEILDYSGDFKANVMTASDANVTICYAPRGFAQENCSSNTNNTVVRFARASDTTAVRVRLLGQVEAQ